MITTNQSRAITEIRFICWSSPQEQKVFQKDSIYTDNELFAEAIEMLEVLVKDGSKSARVYRTLGDRYLQVELPDLAEPQYIQAVKLAIALGI